MYTDSDIKIAGEKPSRDVKRNALGLGSELAPDKAVIKAAELWGSEVALCYINDAFDIVEQKENYTEMLAQKHMLLAFTATVGFEQFCQDDILIGIAQKSFLDTIKSKDAELYKTASDTGAFSFYYLAFRRGGEIERRVGQTFAMLCSHDGDPIFQELGEALYCWFLSVVKKSAAKCGII